LCLKINLGAQCHSYTEFATQKEYTFGQSTLS
jgi:hypothetical protein